MEHLPNELLGIIFADLDVLSKIYVKSTCKNFCGLVEIEKDDVFTLLDNGERHEFQNVQQYIDYIYTSLIDSEYDRKAYNLTIFPDSVIAFCRKRIKDKYKYYVTIETRYFSENVRMFYEPRTQKYKFYTFGTRAIEIPAMFYVLGLRFLMKIYKFDKSVDYNFDKNIIPAILQKCTKQNYNGDLFSEITKDFFVIL